MRWEDEDVDMGNTEIGESNYGMQSGPFVGGPQVSRLRSQVGQLAAGRFGGHAPVAKRLRSQYRDSGQLGIVITQTITLSSPSATNWTDVSLTGSSTVFTSFKPNRIVVNEILTVQFAASGQTTTNVVASVADASDLLLTGGFSGSINAFPNAPNAATGVNCAALQAGAFGVGISWPTVNPGIPVTVNLLLKSSALFRATIPSGFTSVSQINSMTVNVYLTMFGPQLR